MKPLLFALIALSPVATCAAAIQPALDITVDTSGWAGAPPENVRAVALSAAGEIWKHCPRTRMDAIYLHHRSDWPQTDWERGADGKIVIGIASEETRWAQMAFQFAHEFCHALATHSNDWKKTWREDGKPNHWLEESICETASLFALRAMSKSWETAPPYRNWTDYAKSLAGYARRRIDEPERKLPPGETFGAWLRKNEPEMRAHSTLRDKNCIVAAQLLPLFESEPRGWEAMTFFNLGPHDKSMPLARFLAEWQRNCPADLRPFVGKIARVLGIAL